MAKAALWILAKSQSWETNRHKDNRLASPHGSPSVAEYVNFDNAQRMYLVFGAFLTVPCSLVVELNDGKITTLFDGSAEDCQKRFIAIWQAVNRAAKGTGFLFVDMNEHIEDEEVEYARELVGVPPADRSSGDNGGAGGTA